MPKRFTQQGKIGEQGVSLIHQRVADMGFIWHPRRVDHGIDGEIELVDRASGTPLNQVVFVQSRASNRHFSGENDDEFSYVCDPSDLDYWLTGNAPVILVVSHPEKGLAWWASVKHAFPDSAARQQRRILFDKKRDVFDASAAEQILRLGIPRSRGIYLRSPPRPERLTTNLLPVDNYATTIWCAPTPARRPRDAIETLKSSEAFASDWILADKMVFSFRPLDEPPLSYLAAGPPEALQSAEWAFSKNPELVRRFVRLLNQSLAEVFHRELRRHSRGPLYFRATRDLSPRRIASGKSKSGVVVFQAYPHPQDPSRTRWCRHHALEHQFLCLEGSWYLSLQPTYLFTFDGYRDVPWGSELVKEMKRRERNVAVRRLVGLWANYLRVRRTLFDQPDWRLSFGKLLTLDVDRGIDDIAWQRDAGAQTSHEDSGPETSLFETSE